VPIEYCPVCGYGPFQQPYESFQDINGSYDICGCCGCEYGNDNTIEYYDKWVSEGCTWFRPEHKPKEWKLEEQIKFQIRPLPSIFE